MGKALMILHVGGTRGHDPRRVEHPVADRRTPHTRPL